MKKEKFFKIILLVFLSGCAYFNTFYNATQYFYEAEKIYKKQGLNALARRKYDKVIEKCSKVLDRYPRSKYVDDALYLMAVSYMRIKEYPKARRKFKELFTFFPHSKLLKKAWIDYIELLIEMEEYDSAAQYIAKLKEKKNTSLIMAQLTFKKHNYIKTLKIAREFIKKPHGIDKESRIEILFLGLQSAFYLRDYKSVIEIGEKLLKLEPEEKKLIIILDRLTDSYLALNKPQTALKIIEKYQGKFHQASYRRYIFILKARVYTKLNQFSKASTVLDSVFKYNRGDTLSLIAKYEYAGILELQDSLKKAYKYYGEIKGRNFKDLGSKAKKRYEALSKIIELADSLSCENRFKMAEIYLTDLHEVRKAKRYYWSVLKDSTCVSLYPRTVYALSYIYKQEGKIDSVSSIFKIYPFDSLPTVYRDLLREELGITPPTQKTGQ